MSGDTPGLSPPKLGTPQAAAPSPRKIWGPMGASHPWQLPQSPLCSPRAGRGHGDRCLQSIICTPPTSSLCPPQDYRLGIGITYIEMNVGNVKEVDRRGFDLTTPYRIFR